MSHEIRNRVIGVSNINDRLWLIEVNKMEEAITEYNQEITGFTPNLANLPNIGRYIHYSGNAYYVLNELQKCGFIVTEYEDRK